jgi:hypothetical protein
MMDGVYSMYGDFAPINKIIILLHEYHKLNIYVDDAHGMGWVGVKGQGYILSQVELHSKIILATSLNKAFPAGGGVFVFKDKELRDRVRNCGTSFIFSAPHAIPVLGAAIAAAKIFLSEEIYELQAVLAERVHFCQSQLEKYNLPVVSNPDTPIFFIGCGLPRVGYNMVDKIINSGFFASICAFPAVPENCTGIRFTITLHHSLEDIEKFVETLAYCYYETLIDEERTIEDVQRAFRRVALFRQKKQIISSNPTKEKYHVELHNSITKISSVIWNQLMSGRCMMGWDELSLLERTFSKNDKPEDNWKFYYYIVKDQNKTPVCATFFTLILSKDDTLAPSETSMIIELERKKYDPYLYTSLALTMGSVLTEGNHLYLDRARKDWQKILMLLLDEVWKQQDIDNAKHLYMRDFESMDEEIKIFFKDQGFIQVDMPDTYTIENNNSSKDYLQQLRSHHRHYIKKKAIEFENFYQTKIVANPNITDLKNYYQLYKNVAMKSFQVNGFIFPFKLFKEIASSSQWEFIELTFKDKSNTNNKLVGVAINHIGKEKNYNFLLTGMDYEYLEYNLYPQILWQIVCRANELKMKTISLGVTASQNKRKFGAISSNKIGFMQSKDHFNMMKIEMIKNDKK